jgi:outer membrane lipoprotein-sorting protein
MVCLLLAFGLGGRAGAQSPDLASPDAPAKNSQSNVPKLDEVLGEMDKSAEDFSSMTGDLEYTKVTVIVNDHSTQTGRISFEKSGGKTRVLIAFAKPAEKYVLFSDGKVSLYQPRIAEVDEYQLSQRQDLLEQFLLLGFGTPGSEIQKAYQISLHGAETVGGQQAYLLELTPKSVKVAAQLARIQLWISPKNWEPLQQKFFEPGGDYLIARYSNVKLNAKIPDKDFRLPIKGKVRTVRPQSQ